MPKPFNPSQETHTEFLRRKMAMVGHLTLSQWMRKQGYPFNYCYYVIFGKPRKQLRCDLPAKR